MGAAKIPVGPARGKTITECSVAELEAACDDVDARVCAARKGEASKRHKLFLGVARPLLRARKFPVGIYSETDDANRALRDAAAVGYLLGPSDQVARVLEGTAIVVSAIRADVHQDTFPDDEDPSRRLPAKPLLDRLANQLGLSWDARNCHRTDSGSSPYVRACHAAGVLTGFDGSPCVKQAHGEIDLQNGSPLFKAILERYQGNKGRIELERRRQHILAHADTAARLRVIRQLGLRDSYLPTELAKPFFVARVQFTGQTTDPVARQTFAERIAERFLPSTNALFGAPAVTR